MMRNIVLIGLPGSGKTTLGPRAAEAMNLEFLDLDHDIERQAGLSIPEIFRRFGQEHFRLLETAALLKSLERSGQLIAAGGGVVTRRENISALKKNNYVIFLDRAAEKIMESVTAGDSRPLLKGDLSRLRTLSDERRELYLEAADLPLPNQGGEAEGLESLLAVIRAEMITDGYAVIGAPIIHSLSPAIHGAVFESLGCALPYRAFHVPPSRLPVFVERVRRSNIAGFNITIPHKQAIMPLLDEIDSEAQLCGSVNTVVKSQGRLIGYNTDMDGLCSSLKDHGSGFAKQKVLILGAGGAAGSIAFKAARAGADKVAILARRLEQADEAAERARLHSGSKINTGPLIPESMKRAAAGADLLINCTPLGMHGIAADFEFFDFLDHLPSGAVVCDLIYKPAKTKLLLEAEKRGLTILNGLGMLIHQAILADEHYLNKKLDQAGLYQKVISALALKNAED